MKKQELAKTNVKVKTQPMGCPCCEAESKVVFNADILRTGDKFYKITCPKCNVQTASYKTEDEVVAVWNTRPEHKIFRTFAV